MSLGFVKRKIRTGRSFRIWISKNDTHNVFSLETIDSLYEEIKIDFPNVTKKDIEIVRSDPNCSMPNTIGIGFFVAEGVEIPASYREYEPSYV